MKNEITAKFKDSPLGPIPQDWEVKRLGAICSLITKGTTPTSIGCNFTQSGVKFLKAESISENGTIRGDMVAYVDEHTNDILYRSKLQEGDLLFSIAGVLGRVGLVSKDILPANTNQALAIIRLYDTLNINRDYIFYCLHAEYVGTDIRNYSIGVAQANLSLENVSNLKLAVPPLPEQERIAETLGEMDSLIESLDVQIEKKRLVAKGVAHDLLGMRNEECGMMNEPIRRLPGFKGEWVKYSFDEVFSLLGNNTYSREFLCDESSNAFDIHYGDILIRYGAIVDFSREHIPCLKDGIKPNKDCLQDGDVVFADTAEDEMVGKAIEIRGLKGVKVVAGLHTMPCRPREGTFAPEFLGYYLNSDSYHKQLLPLITGSKVSALSRANFASTTLWVPSTIAEQEAISETLSEMDAAIAALETKRDKYMRIKEGVMRDLLSGKKRLKGG